MNNLRQRGDRYRRRWAAGLADCPVSRPCGAPRRTAEWRVPGARPCRTHVRRSSRPDSILRLQIPPSGS